MGISQVTTCKGRYSQVAKNIKRWLNSGIDELVLVDYDCPQETGLKIARDFKSALNLTVAIIKPELAGKYFHLTKARNIGAIAAKHEVLFFCDADAWATELFIERARDKFEEGKADVLVNRLECASEHAIHRAIDLPLHWCLDGQCFIRNYLFYSLNGYNEAHTGWGGESYDLCIRSASCGAQIGSFERLGIYMTPHTDELRTEYLQRKFDKIDRKTYYAKSLRFLKRNRKLSRVNPGQRFGADIKESKHITLFRNGKQRVWRPGEDDLII